MGHPFPELVNKRLTNQMKVGDFAAFLLYLGLSLFLFLPFLNADRFKVVCVANSAFAAWGAYYVSKRWVNNWTPSFFAGTAYGLGPFALSFAVFHPMAGFSFVMVPWLLLPAISWHKGKAPDAFRFLVRATLTLLPFAGIVLLFWISTQQWAGPIFLMPKDMTLTAKDFMDMIFPLYKSGGIVVFGLFGSMLLLALMGLFVYIKLQRVALLIPIATGLVLAFSRPVFEVTPVVWASFGILFLSVLCGLGFQALLWAGKADMKWVLSCAIAASILAAFFGGLAYKRLIMGGLLEMTAAMYALTAAALWVVFFMVATNLRWGWFKWAVLVAASSIDLIYSARYLIGKLL